MGVAPVVRELINLGATELQLWQTSGGRERVQIQDHRAAELRRSVHGCWNRRHRISLARMDTEPVRAALRSSEQW